VTLDDAATPEPSKKPRKRRTKKEMMEAESADKRGKKSVAAAVTSPGMITILILIPKSIGNPWQKVLLT
jgi:hypothetical protein